MEKRTDVIIEPLNAYHAEHTWLLRNNPALWQYTECDTPLPATLQSEQQAYLFYAQQKNNRRYAVKFNGRCIGVVSLKQIWYGTAAIGYYILDDSMHGKGICTEAVRQLMRIGFEEFNLDLLYILVNSDNIPSFSVAQKLGFYSVGLSFTKSNVHRFEMTRTVWRNKKNELK